MAVDITKEQLEELFPKAADGVIDAFMELEDWIASEGLLETPAIWCHFMAQIAHESGGLRLLEENLNYRADQLVKTFSKYYNDHSAKRDARNPEAIANVVYGGRMGNTAPGDGWAYRGRGLIQLTGKENYGSYGPLVDEDLIATPDKASDPAVAVKLAVMYFVKRGCLEKAKKNDLSGVTKLVNGGHNGLKDRADWLAKARKVWGEGPGVGIKQIVEKSKTIQSGISAVAVSAGGVVTKVVGEGGDPIETLKQTGETATQIQNSATPILKLFDFALANMWQGIAIVSLGAIGFMLYRHFKAYLQGRIT